jgi:dTDP-4-amino-4,6-dideoxygalactose transaminase
MDPALLEAVITARTRAIIPVHLFGQMADMTSICQIAAKHNIPVVEDASQAHLAEHNSQKAGSIAELGCFSFYPGKNLGAYGEAGAVTTNNEQLALKMRMIRDHGQSKKYYHDVVGCNARMDGIQGAVLSVKLKHLNAWTDARREHAAHYNRLLDGIDNFKLPVEADGNKHVYHIYALRVSERDAIMKKLAENGIGSGIHYPLPLHLQKAYQHLGYGVGDFPVSERICSELLSLPMYAELEEEQIEYVADKLADIIA